MADKNIKLKTKSGDVLLPITLGSNVSYGAIDSGVSIDQKIANAWDKDNLKGGTNISINKHLNPYVIDSSTLALFHFDGNFNNEIENSSFSIIDEAVAAGHDSYFPSDGEQKFGTAASDRVYYNGSWYYRKLSINKYTEFPDGFTIDFWAKRPVSDDFLTKGIIPGGYGFYVNGYGYVGFGLGAYSSTLYLSSWNTRSDTTNWHHIAVSVSSTKQRFFVDGVLVVSLDVAATPSLAANATSSFGQVIIDELRITDAALWQDTDDFSANLPVGPYEKSSTADYWEINANGLATTTQVAAKQDTLVSGTNIKTINNTSILGSGNIDISGGDSLPDQTDHAGQFLTTDGADASWTPLDTLPVKLTDNEYTMVEFDGGMLPVPVCVDTLAVDPNTEYIVLLSLDDIAPGTVVRYDVSVAGGKGQLIQTLRIPSLLPNGVATRESDTSTGLWRDWNVTQMVVTSQLESNIVQNSTNPVQSQALYTAFAGKQATLVSGTNIKTVNGTSLLGSGDLAIGTDSLPDQTGQSGKFLTTDGSALSWGSAIPATEKGAASGVAPLDANSKVAETYLPSTTLKNTATVTWALTIDGAANTTHGESVNIGHRSNIQGACSVAIGEDSTTGTYGTALGAFAYGSGQGSIAIGSGAPTKGAEATATGSIAIGTNAKATAADAIQLGTGSNATAGTFNVALGTDKNYQLLTNDGKVPNDRLNVMTGTDGTTAGTAGLVPAPAATDTGKFLKADGTWAEVQGGGVSVPTLTWYTADDWTLSQDGLTLTIADTSSANLVKVYRNGVLLQPTVDYTISGTSLVVPTALTETEKITLEVF